MKVSCFALKYLGFPLPKHHLQVLYISDHLISLYFLGGETWSTATEDLSIPPSAGSQLPNQDSVDYHAAGNMENHNGNQGVADSPSPHGIGGFQCGKCSMKFQDTDSFRGHVEKCFN